MISGYDYDYDYIYIYIYIYGIPTPPQLTPRYSNPKQGTETPPDLP